MVPATGETGEHLQGRSWRAVAGGAFSSAPPRTSESSGKDVAVKKERGRFQLSRAGRLRSRVAWQ